MRPAPNERPTSISAGGMVRAPTVKVTSISNTDINTTSTTRASNRKPNQITMNGTKATGGMA